jgi:hypothetical protein
MKGNEAPEKIYIQPNAHDGWFETNNLNGSFIEYVRKDTLIEKALEWIRENIRPYYHEVRYKYEDFEKYMKGE